MLPGMKDLADRVLFTNRELAEQLTEQFVQETHANIEADDWSPAERTRIHAVEKEKYGNMEWNAKR